MCGYGPVIEPRPVFRRDRLRLLDLLADLDPRDWQRPTVCDPWRVRDVVAHLLGDDLGRLSRSRDRHEGGDVPQDGETFPELLARLNDRWVRACAGLSPVVLLAQLRASTEAVLAFWDGLDLGVLGEPVTWAGPEPAPRWLDCARDFTEYWTHQRQIRDAVGAAHPGDPEVDHVALDTFLRAVPYTLRDVHGGTVSVTVHGPAGGRWSWAGQGGGWARCDVHPAEPTATVTVDEDTLWRLCTRGIGPVEARARARASVTGAAEITDTVLTTVSIIY